MKYCLVVFGIGVLLTSFAGAQERIFDGPALSYSHFDFGYEGRSFDSSKLGDGDGGFLEFSFGAIPFLYFTGEVHYSRAEDFISGDDIDFVDGDLGLGLRFTILDTLSLYVESGLAYTQLNVSDIDGFDRDDLGFFLEPGVKLGLFGRVELNAALKYKQFDGDAVLGGKVGAVIGITEGFGITFDAGVDEDSDYFGIGVRFAW